MVAFSTGIAMVARSIMLRAATSGTITLLTTATKIGVMEGVTPQKVPMKRTPSATTT